MSNGLDPDQDRRSVGHDLGPNCLKRLSTEVKSPLAKKELIKATGQIMVYSIGNDGTDHIVWKLYHMACLLFKENKYHNYYANMINRVSRTIFKSWHSPWQHFISYWNKYFLRSLTLCMLVIFSCFLFVICSLFKTFFECQIVWIQIWTNILSVLI